MNSDLYKKNPNSIILNISHLFAYRLLKSQLLHNHVNLRHNGRDRAFQLNNLSGQPFIQRKIPTVSLPCIVHSTLRAIETFTPLESACWSGYIYTMRRKSFYVLDN